MSKTYVMTLRLPETLGREVERTAARQGNKAAPQGPGVVDEGVRGRPHPLATRLGPIPGQAHIGRVAAYVIGLSDNCRRGRIALHGVGCGCDRLTALGSDPGATTGEFYMIPYDIRRRDGGQGCAGRVECHRAGGRRLLGVHVAGSQKRERGDRSEPDSVIENRGHLCLLI